MIMELALSLLVLAALLALSHGLFGIYDSFFAKTLSSSQLTQRLAVSVFLLVSCAFFLLIYAFAISDFSVANVYENSHTAKPLLYKITGTWGNHEGSMLLWLWMITGFSCAFGLAGRSAVGSKFYNASLAVLALINAGLLFFILFTSNPFARLDPVPFEGMDLNPLLQDVGLAFHPPLLYLGYVGFSLVFALTVGALLCKETIDSKWAKLVQPWALLSWAFLTFGIGLGSWWAYRELGWGGWWFWDPVENISLLPWLSGTALIHCLMVLGKRPILQNWTVLLSLLTFALSLIGTFLVRSGLLTSVHSFASDPARGTYILAFTTLLVGGSLWLYGLRYPKPSLPDFHIISRESSILVNNLLIVSFCATVFLGVIYPILLQVFGLPAVSVGAPYYNTILLPLALPLLTVAGISPFLSWKSANPKLFLEQCKHTVMIVIPVTALVAIGQSPFLKTLWDMKLALCCAIAGIILAAATIAYGLRLWRIQGQRISLTHSGIILAHGGLAVFAISASLATAGRMEWELPFSPGETQLVAGYEIHLESIKKQTVDNYRSTQAIFDFAGTDKQENFRLTPENRFYPSRRMETAEAAINSHLSRDIYTAISLPSDQKNSDKILLRIYRIPLANGLWLGFIFTGFGGMIVAVGYFRAVYRRHIFLKVF